MNIVKFNKIALDFVNDIDLVFPEYKVFENDIYRRLRDSELENTDGEIYTYCKKLYPKHFFDILYKNDNLFDDNIYLIPEINFKNVWESNTSKETKSKIWQYLQLLLMCITEQMDNSSDFGDATQLFDLLDENEFKKKLAETFEELSETFTKDLSGVQFDKDVKDVSSNNNFDNFNPESIHEHLSSLMNGKIGCLAKEIAGDTLNDLDIDPSNGNTQEVFESLIKDPTKLMSLMKKIGDKIENKIKKGEINQEELMSEASELFKNMKDMPGFEEMFNKMAKSQMGRKGGKVPSMSSMESILERNTKASKQRKQMLQRLQEKHSQLETNNPSVNEIECEKIEMTKKHTDEEIMNSFLEGGIGETLNTSNSGTNNKKSGKKKKKKK